jgi:hypothetical protein
LAVHVTVDAYRWKKGRDGSRVPDKEFSHGSQNRRGERPKKGEVAFLL